MTRFVQFLMEGGNAVTVVSRINQSNVKATVDKIYSLILPRFKIKKSDTDRYALLGSAGKKKIDESSGDLDIALDVTFLMKQWNLPTPEDVTKKLSEIIVDIATEIFKKHRHDGHAVKDFFKLMPGLRILSIGYPIENTDRKQEGQFVQVDFILSTDITHVRWAMSAPHYSETSIKNSAAVRNNLISSMAKACDFKILKQDDSGKATEWKRYLWDRKEGLFHITQGYKLGKTGKYTTAKQITERKLITANPDKIVEFFFGSKHKAGDISTYEKLWELLNSDDFKFPHKRKEIIDEFKQSLITDGLETPDHLKDVS